MEPSSSAPEAQEAGRSLVDLIRTEVETFWNNEVSIVGTWDANDAAVVVFRLASDDVSDRILGRVFRAGPNIADGEPAGAAEDAALVLAEPPGAILDTAYVDENGIMWLGLGSSQPPKPPAHIRDGFHNQASDSGDRH